MDKMDVDISVSLTLKNGLGGSSLEEGEFVSSSTVFPQAVTPGLLTQEPPVTSVIKAPHVDFTEEQTPLSMTTIDQLEITGEERQAFSRAIELKEWLQNSASILHLGLAIDKLLREDISSAPYASNLNPDSMIKVRLTMVEKGFTGQHTVGDEVQHEERQFSLRDIATGRYVINMKNDPTLTEYDVTETIIEHSELFAYISTRNLEKRLLERLDNFSNNPINRVNANEITKLNLKTIGQEYLNNPANQDAYKKAVKAVMNNINLAQTVSLYGMPVSGKVFIPVTNTQNQRIGGVIIGLDDGVYFNLNYVQIKQNGVIYSALKLPGEVQLRSGTAAIFSGTVDPKFTTWLLAGLSAYDSVGFNKTLKTGLHTNPLWKVDRNPYFLIPLSFASTTSLADSLFDINLAKLRSDANYTIYTRNERLVDVLLEISKVTTSQVATMLTLSTPFAGAGVVRSIMVLSALFDMTSVSLNFIQSKFAQSRVEADQRTSEAMLSLFLSSLSILPSAKNLKMVKQFLESNAVDVTTNQLYHRFKTTKNTYFIQGSETLRQREAKTAFLDGFNNHNMNKFAKLDKLSLEQQFAAFNPGASGSKSMQLTHQEMGALAMKIEQRFSILAKTSEASSVKFWFEKAARHGGTQIYSVPQSCAITGCIGDAKGHCYPLTILMTLAVEKGTSGKLYDKLLRAAHSKNEIFIRQLDAIHNAGSDSSKALAKAIRDSQSASKLGRGLLVSPLKLNEATLFTKPTQSFQINLPNHAMSISRVAEGDKFRYYFYEPNYGVLWFESFNKMKYYIDNHIQTLDYDEIDIKLLDFNSILNSVDSIEFEGETLKEIIESV